MKKISFLLSALLFLTLTINAQVELKGLIGTNFATFHGSDQDVSAKAGIQYGAGVLIGNKFYVEPGIQFVTSASSFTYEGANYDFTQNLVKIPVYFGYHLLGSEDKPIALRVFAGPTMSIPGKIKKGPEQITKDDINNSIWAIDGGLGLDILFLFVEANYEYSLNDYFAAAANANGKHGAFIINAGIHIDF
jgi:Outer membrane protein beta-barrel domain